uniref:uncharacterized protein LOC105351315 n=1 Tax=Fragaria vesca subsp. vesca TaxID=101020 RepID=UPI0005CA7562|nr:PREDICTED: uncharacterized protein LOC105351315 [Fragaria vesca subsp. vesca]
MVPCPGDKHEAQRLRHKASLYLLRGRKLYHRGQSCPLLRCLPTAEGHKVLKSLHSGVCGNHAGARNLMFKTLRAGYYWPTLEQDAKAVVQACLHCHKFANFAHRPLVPLSVIISPVLFSQEFLSKQGTAIFYASPAHPQTNGQVEAINKLIKQNLKKRLEDAKGLWAAKLPEVLWTLHTTPTTATGESLYLLSYGTEAVIPVEMEVPSERVTAYDPETNATGLRLNMDLLEERRDRAHLKNVNYKQKVARHYNKTVISRPLKVGDWVMKEVIPHPTGLKAKWEGPLEIVNAPRPATFYLRDTDGRVLPRPWNARHLHLYPV